MVFLWFTRPGIPKHFGYCWNISIETLENGLIWRCMANLHGTPFFVQHGKRNLMKSLTENIQQVYSHEKWLRSVPPFSRRPADDLKATTEPLEMISYPQKG